MMKKVFDGIKKVLSFIFFVIYFVFALIMTILLLNFNDYGVTEFDGTSLIMVNDRISNKEFKKGNLVIVETKKLEEYEVGEYIFTYRIGNDRIPTLQVGKIGTIYAEDKAVAFENGETYGTDYIAGVPVKQYEKLGGVLSIIESKWGFLFIVLIPVFLIFVYEVYALIIEIKYGNEED